MTDNGYQSVTKDGAALDSTDKTGRVINNWKFPAGIENSEGESGWVVKGRYGCAVNLKKWKTVGILGLNCLNGKHE